MNEIVEWLIAIVAAISIGGVSFMLGFYATSLIHPMPTRETLAAPCTGCCVFANQELEGVTP